MSNVSIFATENNIFPRHFYTHNMQQFLQFMKLLAFLTYCETRYYLFDERSVDIF